VFFDDQGARIFRLGGKQRGRFGNRGGAGVAAHGFRWIGHGDTGQLGRRVEAYRPAMLLGDGGQTGFIGLEVDRGYGSDIGQLCSAAFQCLADAAVYRGCGCATVAADSKGDLHGR
jgi:hypothetical protein